MAQWRPDPLLRAILVWTAVTMIVIWLPLIRGAMDGPTYHWCCLLGEGGAGVGGRYWALPIAAAFALALLWLGWRGARQPFHWMLLLWHLPLAYGATVRSLTRPDEFRFRGDTLGIDISLAWMGPTLFGGVALLAVLWVVRDLVSRRERVAPAWTPANRGLLVAALVLLPIQFVLLRFGVPHGATDKVGVLLTLLQWVLLNVAFARQPKPATEAVAA